MTWPLTPPPSLQFKVVPVNQTELNPQQYARTVELFNADGTPWTGVGLSPFPVTTAITYNSDGTVATLTENGVVTTYTYNADGTVATDARGGVTRTYTYDGAGNLTGIA